MCVQKGGERQTRHSKTQHFLVPRGREGGGGMRLGLLAAGDSKLRRRLLDLLINSEAGWRRECSKNRVCVARVNTRSISMHPQAFKDFELNSGVFMS